MEKVNIIQKVINHIQVLRLISKNSGIFSIVEAIFKFISEVHNDGRPRTTQLVIDMPTTGKTQSIVSLWAGVGDANPVDRARHLAAQKEDFRKILDSIKENDFIVSDSQKLEIYLMLKYFN